MKINLNIQEDQELRNEVKKIIRGQVKKIIKEEIAEIVKEEFGSESKKDYYRKKVDKIFNKGLSETIKEELNILAVNEDFHESFIVPKLKEIVNKHLETMDIERLIKRLAKEMLLGLLAELKIKGL